MKIALIVLGVLLAIPLGLAAVGAMLPRRHTASRRLSLRAAPERVFALLADHAGAAAWRSDVKRVEVVGGTPERPVFVEHGKHGPIRYEVMEAEKPRRYVTRVADETLPFGGRWIWELAPSATGTLLTITEDGEVKPPIFRALARFVFGYTSTMDSVLGDLARHLGEDAQPQAV